MPSDIPQLRKHKPSGRAVVTLNQRDIYLGRFGSAAAKRAYDRTIGEWLARGRRPPPREDDEPITILELIAAFWDHCQDYYRRPDGSSTGESASFKAALRPLKQLYADLPAVDFSPLKLKTVRNAMIEKKWKRTTINKNIDRIRNVFKWAVAEELISPDVLHALQAVAGLKAGRSEAPEGEAVKPVPIEHVRALFPHVSRQVKAIIELQLLTGMRPGECVSMTGAAIDTTGKLWVYRPATHKTLHHGHRREIYLGPKAQAIIHEFLKPDLMAHLFDPRDAERERLERRHAARKTPMDRGNAPGRIEHDSRGGVHAHPTLSPAIAGQSRVHVKSFGRRRRRLPRSRMS